MLLGPLRTDELRRAVREPAADAGLLLEPGLEELLVTVAGPVTVRRPAPRTGVLVTVLRPMIHARLVTAGRESVEIAHEALLTGWPAALATASADWTVALGPVDPRMPWRGCARSAAPAARAQGAEVPELCR